MSSTIAGLPPGAVVTPLPAAQAAPQSDSSQIQGLPAGAVVTPIQSAPDQTTQSDQNNPPQHGAIADLGLKAISTASDVAAGFAKGAGDTVSGVSHLINKIPGVGEILAPSQGIGALDQTDTATNTAQKVGKLGEGIAEFATGDEALEGLAKASKIVALADKYPQIARVLELAKEHPVLQKIITSAGKSGVVGATQGAVKGAQEGDAVRGAVAGGVGGAVGGAAGAGIAPAAEAAAPYLKKVGQAVGLGRDAVDSLTRALRPTGKAAASFPDQAKLALPSLAEINKTNPITNLDELAQGAHDAAKNMWNNQIVPQINEFKNEVISGKPIANAIRGGVSSGDKDLFEGAADAAETLAKKFDGDMTLQQASNRLQSLNRQTASLYKMDPSSRYFATAGKPSLEAMEDAANELRVQIYSKLEDLGEKDPAGLRKTYGALKSVEQAANKRAVVYGRQNPISLSEILATAGGAAEAAGAVFSGHPMEALAGAVPIVVAKVAKHLNAPETLIRSALEDALKEVSPRFAVPAAVSRAAGLAGGAAGSGASQAAASPDQAAEQSTE